MQSAKETKIALARIGGAVILNSFTTLAVFPNGETKVLSSFTTPAKEDNFKITKARSKIKAKRKEKPLTSFSVKSSEVVL